MSTQEVTLLFALLAVACQVAVVVAVVGTLAARSWAPAARARAAVLDAVGPQALGLAFLVATVATLGSLYLSEVAGFRPCPLCWYQRAAMYPLALILGLAWWRRWFRVWPLVLAVALVGAAISTYHVVLERYPQLETTACDPTNPCTVIWVRHLGYLTIPAMALSGFALIAVLMLVARHEQRLALDTTADTSPTTEPDRTTVG